MNGFLYVVGGYNGALDLDSVELYNPLINKWTMIPFSMNMGRSDAGVIVVDKPKHYILERRAVPL